MATIDLGKLSFTQKGTYSNSTSYAPKDVVQHTDQNETSSFVKITSTATGQAPQTNGTLNSSHWAIFAKGTSLATPNLGVYAGGTTYSKGAVVQFTDTGVVSTYLYINNTPAAGQTPSTGGTVNSTYWQLLAKGTASVAISWNSPQTSNFTAQANNAYPVDTSGGSDITVSLPASPSAGDRVLLKDYARTWQTNAVIVSPNGSDKFQGSTQIDPVFSSEGDSADLVYIDSTKGWLNITNSELNVNKVSIDTRFLVVAGGGSAGSDNGGGGGAGGVRGGLDDANGKFTPQSATTYTVTVGQGGSGSAQSYNNGSNSSLSGSGLTTQTATGGGKGGSGTPTAGSNGGSGGGSGQNNSGGSGNTGGFSPVEGHDGGSSNNAQSGGSGGGGWGGAGQGADGSSGQASTGHGGIAKISNITGSDIYYAGGSGGGSNQAGQAFSGLGGNSSTTSVKGGAGDGGHSDAIGGDGVANTGGGAGGSSQNYNGNSAPTGGSGVVIIRIPSTIYASSTGSPTITDHQGAKVLKFTGSGSFTTTSF